MKHRIWRRTLLDIRENANKVINVKRVSIKENDCFRLGLLSLKEMIKLNKELELANIKMEKVRMAINIKDNDETERQSKEYM